ncbi:PIG-L family deacetylase [Pseudomonadota bacterium]
MFSNSIIIAAHPDDEVLWFSSILSKVDEIVLCFLAVPSKPVWTEGRQKSLNAYPLNNVHCLELVESEVFEGVDWDRPVTTEFGLRITENRLSDKAYKENFHLLKTRLRDHIRGCDNVFTHNSWGEYGHVEHVQVYRAVKALQEEMQFNLWFSNYASNKSAFLMASQLPELTTQVTMQTNKPLAERIAEIYKRNDCWTWYDDYVWSDSEVFIKETVAPSDEARYGALLQINLIKIGIQPDQPSSLERLSLKLRGKLKKLLLAT